uniref:Neuropeptide n=1 Tax=Echinococcus granulosus TaxID=6210 RepID=A0A068WSJ3_ECHGR|nr:neuropeptide [Echinococcus granulosus]
MVKKVTLVSNPIRPISWFGLACLVIIVLSYVSEGEAHFDRASVEEILPSKSGPAEARKQIFRNVREFRRYLQRLDEWLAITGRPRFG